MSKLTFGAAIIETTASGKKTNSTSLVSVNGKVSAKFKKKMVMRQCMIKLVDAFIMVWCRIVMTHYHANKKKDAPPYSIIEQIKKNNLN